MPVFRKSLHQNKVDYLSFKFCYLTQTILFNIIHLFAYLRLFPLLFFYRRTLCPHDYSVTQLSLSINKAPISSQISSQVSSWQGSPSWWDALQPAVMQTARFWSGVSRHWTYLEPRGAVDPGFNPPWRG